MMDKSERRPGEDTLTLKSSKDTGRWSRSRSRRVWRDHPNKVLNSAVVQESAPSNHAETHKSFVAVPKRMPRNDKAEQAELDAEVLRKVQHDDMCCDVVAELLRVAPDKTLPHKTILADNMVLHHLSHGGTTNLVDFSLHLNLVLSRRKEFKVRGSSVQRREEEGPLSKAHLKTREDDGPPPKSYSKTWEDSRTLSKAHLKTREEEVPLSKTFLKKR
jgi:hypothetical protein